MIQLMLLFFSVNAYASDGLKVEPAKVVQVDRANGTLEVMVGNQLERRSIENADVLTLLRSGDTVLLYNHGLKTEAFPTAPVQTGD